MELLNFKCGEIKKGKLLCYCHGLVLQETPPLVLLITTYSTKKFDLFCSKLSHIGELSSKTMWSYFS